MILHLQQGLKEDGFTVPMTKLYRRFGIPRHTVYCKPVKSTPKVQERFAAPIKQMIEAGPSFGYRTVASLLQFDTNTVLTAEGLAGSQTSHRASPSYRDAAVGRHDAERTLGNGTCTASGRAVMAGRPWPS
jgi:putative transposase